MTRARFWKLSGAGNDFVLLEGRPGLSTPALARRLCDRRAGIGADGLLVVGAGARPTLSYRNADGSEAFCGNGTRCAAWWLRATGRQCADSFLLETNRGLLPVVVTGRERAKVRMPAATDVRLSRKVSAGGRAWTVHSMDTGVPHAVVEVRGLARVPVKTLGRELRFHKAFGKAGANVDFLEKDGRVWRLRTYERGVEDETLACGTGVVAAAVAAHLAAGARPPVRVRVAGGAELVVEFQPGRLDELWLEGPARVVFEGEVPL